MQQIENFIRSIFGEVGSDLFLSLCFKSDQGRFVSKFIEANQLEKLNHHIYYEVNPLTDIYYGVGLLGEKPAHGRGKAEDVIAIPGCWMDVDVAGPTHKTENLPKSIDEATEFINSLGLEPTVIVNSGGGFHVYWLFKELWAFCCEEEQQEAAELVKRFQQGVINKGRENGWQLDDTSDLARVLRLPGTFNYKIKSDPVKVEIISECESCRYKYEEIEEWVERMELNYNSAIFQGERNKSLFSIGCAMRGQGKGYDEIFDELLNVNSQRCKPLLERTEVETIARSASGYEPGQGDEGDGNSSGERISQRDQVIRLVNDYEYIHDADGTSFVSYNVKGHKETWPVKSTKFRSHLVRLYFKEFGGSLNSQAKTDAISHLDAMALEEGEERKVFNRIAEHEGAVFIDLCDEDWRVVQIDNDGWKITNNSPVAFVRNKGTKSLPQPLRDGSLEDLKKLINVDEDSFKLIVGFMVGCLNPDGPYPLLFLNGEQGSAKSTTQEIIKNIIDPADPSLESMPTNERELMITLKNCHLLSFDNLSGISGSMSDALCRVATGSGFKARSLFTDADQIVFKGSRPVMLNGINNIVQRGDLASRSLVVNLPPIPAYKRSRKQKLMEEFESRLPSILGGLCDVLSEALRNRHKVQLQEMPRMADFVHWVISAEPALPWNEGAFLKAFDKMQVEASDNVLDSDVFASAILTFMCSRDGWEGKPSELLKELNKDEIVDESSRKQWKGWPKSASQVWNKIVRVGPALREVGIEYDRQQGGDRKITLTNKNSC
jgi:hypothetical protein